MSETTDKSLCLCGSESLYKNCCQPYHEGRLPATPEALMRSRYSAYALGNVRYIMETTHPDSPYYQKNKSAWIKSLKTYTTQTAFIGLQVHEATSGEDEKTGFVSFTAILLQNGRNASFTEKSRFLRVNNRWLYVDGEIT